MKTLLKILLVIIACATIVTMLPYVIMTALLLVVYALLIKESVKKSIENVLHETKWVIGDFIDSIIKVL